MTRCPSSLTVRDMRVKTTRRCYLVLVRMALAVNPRTALLRVWKKGTPECPWWECHLENSMDFPQKVNNRATVRPSQATSGR